MGDSDQEQARRLIRAALAETGVTPTYLARVAGVSHTTLTRFLHNPDVKHAPSMRTMNKITMAVTRIRLAQHPVPIPAKPQRPKRGTKPRLVGASAKRGRL